VTPLDPSGLGSLPAPLRPDGNAYRIEIAYSPSKAPVPTLTSPGDLFLTAPEPAEAILYSADGRTWEKVETRHVAADSVVGTPFTRAGWYVIATSAPPPTTIASGGSGGSAVAVIAVIAVAAAVVFVLGPWVWWRRTRRRPPPHRRTASSRRRRP